MHHTHKIQSLQSTRILRLASVMGQHSAQMRKMYYTVTVSLPQCLNLVVAMMVVLHVFSVFACELCAGAPHGEHITTYDNFDTESASIRVLFQIATGQNYGGIIIECKDQSPHPSLVTPFFFAFFVVGKYAQTIFSIYSTVLSLLFLTKALVAAVCRPVPASRRCCHPPLLSRLQSHLHITICCHATRQS